MVRYLLAGVGITDGYQLTADGLDFVFGVNFVGHFELTMKLMPLIQATPASRCEKGVEVNIVSCIFRPSLVQLHF